MDRLIVLTLNEKVNDFAVTSAAYAVAKRYIGRGKGMEERGGFNSSPDDKENYVNGQQNLALCQSIFPLIYPSEVNDITWRGNHVMICKWQPSWIRHLGFRYSPKTSESRQIVIKVSKEKTTMIKNAEICFINSRNGFQINFGKCRKALWNVFQAFKGWASKIISPYHCLHKVKVALLFSWYKICYSLTEARGIGKFTLHTFEVIHWGNIYRFSSQEKQQFSQNEPLSIYAFLEPSWKIC